MIKVEVVTPTGTDLKAECDEVVAPGLQGEFGVLPGHTPFITALKPGVLSWKAKSGPRTVVAVGSGYAEVDGHDRVLVLTQEARPVEKIDAAAAQKDVEDADRLLKEWKETEGGPSRTDVEQRRAWAQARLDALATAR